MSSLGLGTPTLVLGRAHGHEEADELRMKANFWCIATACKKQTNACFGKDQIRRGLPHTARGLSSCPGGCLFVAGNDLAVPEAHFVPSAMPKRHNRPIKVVRNCEAELVVAMRHCSPGQFEVCRT